MQIDINKVDFHHVDIVGMDGTQLEFWGRIAQEYRDGRMLKKIDDERNRQEKYDL